MKRRPSHSHLQNRILLYMEREEVDSLAGLGRKLGHHRSSVSRAMHALRSVSLVAREGQQWVLTTEGKQEAQRVRHQLSEQSTKALQRVSRLVDHSRLGPLTSDSSLVDTTRGLAAMSEAANVTIHGAAQKAMKSLAGTALNFDLSTLMQESLQPLMDAVARVDMLASAQKAAQSLKLVEETSASLPIMRETLPPLVAGAARIDLVASADECLQSIASLVSGVDPLAIGLGSTGSLTLASESSKPVAAALETIEPLANAARRFDSLMLMPEIAQSIANRATPIAAISSAQDAIRPLLSAAVKFDSIVLEEQSMKRFADTVERVSVLVSQEWQQSARMAAEFVESPQLIASLDSIRSLSLRPTVAEVAASHAIHAIGQSAQGIMADLGPRLVQEALASFTHSQQLGRFGMEGLSGMGTVPSTILQELAQSANGLNDIISNLETLDRHGFAAEFDASNLAVLMPNVAEIARTYRGYLADVVGGVNTSLPDYSGRLGLTLPTMTTSDYVGAVTIGVEFEEADFHERRESQRGYARWQERGASLDGVFFALGPNFHAMWQGSWLVLESNSPDRIRQAAHSGRELLMQVLANLAPDSVFSAAEIEEYGYEGRATRKMRVGKLLTGSSASATGWASAVAKALDKTYHRLVAASHDRSMNPETTERQIAGLLHTLGGLLVFIEESQRDCSRYS